MHLSFLNLLSEDKIIKALSWTLLHSLWQGMVLVIATGSVICFTKKANSTIRYNLLVTVLLFFVVGTVITFATQVSTATQVTLINEMQAPAQLNAEISRTMMATAETKFYILNKTVHFINANAYWIALFWFIVIAFKFTRLGIGFYGMCRLKNRHVFAAGNYWNNRLTELCEQLRINKKVKLLQSGIITIPALIGYFKPVILFPAAMFTTLPVHEVEAILIHELGHIRRRDFVVNFLQHTVEIIFFFNPAVLWVSSLIKTERENCCDDIALASTGNKKDYVKALLKFQHFNQATAFELATAFAGRKNHLLQRIERIIYNKNKTLNNMEKNFFSISLILLSACIFTFISINAQKDDKKNILPASQSVFDNTDISNTEKGTKTGIDTIPVYKIGKKREMNGVTNTTVDGKVYKIFIKDAAVTEMYIDGVKIASEKITDYKPILDRIYKQMLIDQEKSEKDMVQSIKDMEQSKADMEQSKKDMEQSKADMKQSKKDMEQSKKDMEQSMKDMEQSKRNMEQSIKDMEQSNSKMNQVISELISDKLITNPKELNSFSLNTVELKINGITQPSVIHKKYMKKYGEGLSGTMSFVYKAD